MIVGLLGMFVYICEVWDVESPPWYAEVSLLIGQGVFGHVGAFWVEEKELPSAESKCPVRRDVFLAMLGVGQSSAEWPFLYMFIIDVQ